MKKTFNAAVLSIALILTVFSILFSNRTAKAAGFENRERDIGISAGMWLEGDVYVGIIDDDATKESDFLLRAFVDSYITPKFTAGAYFNYAPVTLSYAGYSADGNIMEVGSAFKFRFLMSPTVAVKPGLNIGYRKLNSDDADYEGDALGLNLSVEIQVQLQGDIIFFIEPGFLAQPVGGNADSEVTHAPIWYINAGICF